MLNVIEVEVDKGKDLSKNSCKIRRVLRIVKKLDSRKNVKKKLKYNYKEQLIVQLSIKIQKELLATKV